MKNISFLFVGILFGIVMTKSEAISWYRIQEMFLFESFHMYGIIGVAVVLGALMKFIMKKTNFKTIDGEESVFKPKENGVRNIIGGTIFGLGWAMTGACPGPLYTLVGHGYFIILVIIASAVLGAFTYGVFRSKLPH
jgi:uncharacterized protein